MVLRTAFALCSALLLGACSATTSAPTLLGDGDVEDGLVDDTTIEEEDTYVEPEDTRPEDTRKPPTDTRPPACIRPGVSGCSSYGDCCDAECVSGTCCKTRLQTTFVCAANAECCDGFCTGGKCCVPPGQTCALNSMCCSNWCGTKLVPAGDGGVVAKDGTCCNKAGLGCASNDDCCSRNCVTGVCACIATGGACAAFAGSLCCSGSCVFTSGVGYRCN